MNKLFEYYEIEDDNYTKYDPTYTRRPRLTLRHLNLLKKRRELQKYEEQLRKERLQQIYGSGEDDMGGNELGL